MSDCFSEKSTYRCSSISNSSNNNNSSMITDCENQTSLEASTSLDEVTPISTTISDMSTLSTRRPPELKNAIVGHSPEYSTHIDETLLNGHYYKRLSLAESEKINSVVICDWDDTYLLSTYLSKLHPTIGTLNLPKDLWYNEAWDKLEKQLCDTTSKLKQKYPFFIVTNAETEWVKRTCQKFYPRLWNILDEDDTIEIHSARSQYETQYPNDPGQWKQATLRDITTTFEENPCILNEFFAIGDAPHDRIAIQTVAKEKKWNFKNVKFALQPNVRTLTAQWQLLDYTLPCILWSKGNMDLSMTVQTIP